WHDVASLAVLTDIDAQLCDTPWVGGWYPQLGDWHVRTCSVIAYPAQSTVGIVRALEAADVEYRWCTRAVGREQHVQADDRRRPSRLGAPAIRAPASAASGKRPSAR